MEVKIGVQHASRELVLESTQSPDQIEQTVTKAIAAGAGSVLELVDEKGRRVLNFTYEKTLGNGSALGLTLTNLLDDDSVFVQRNTANTRTVAPGFRTPTSSDDFEP